MKLGSDSEGSVVGGILLIAGSCIGAAMLGLPIITGQLGFYPSCILLTAVWLFMACTGLLVLEANLWFGTSVNLTSMAEKTLGRGGKLTAIALFAFLFYSLLVAYVGGSGVLFSELSADFFGLEVPPALGSLIFSVLFAISIYFGVGTVDWVNRAFMLGLFASYGCLLYVGLPKVDTQALQRHDWSQGISVLPAMVISFGFHNLLPSLNRYLKANVKSLRLAIILGSSLPLLLYFLWECVILGLLPNAGPDVFLHAKDQGAMATQLLRDAVGQSWIMEVVELFAFFAIVTSFVGVALSLLDFLADLFHVKRTPSGRLCLALGVIVPPFICALTYPGAFLMALNYAGSLGAAILFGVLPALMVWKGRYHLGLKGERLLPGGRAALLVIMLLASLVVSAIFV